MKIYILRHGERSAGYGDVALSAEGHQQALELSQNPSLKDVDLVFSSPKIRTQQTVSPLCENLQKALQIAQELDQRKSIETEQEFVQRVLLYLDHCVEVHSGKTLLLCSHSDWLQAAIMNLPVPLEKAVAQSFFGCGEFRTLIYKDRTWDLA